VHVRDVILFFLSLSVSLSTSFVPTRSAYLDYNLFNLHVAMCDNDNVVIDEVKLINKLEAQWAEPVSLIFHSALRKLNTKPSIYVLPTKFRFIWLSSFRLKKIFRNRPIRNKNCLWQPCLLTNREEMSIIYREPSIDASYQVSFH
jgi:hypothetical protein